MNFPDPEGWLKPWPFADEIELWRIPESEIQCAADIELKRERTRQLIGDAPFLSDEKGTRIVELLPIEKDGEHVASPLTRLDPKRTVEQAGKMQLFPLAVGLNGWASKGQILSAFGKLLDHLEAGGEFVFAPAPRGKSVNDARAVLQNLAIHRLMIFQPGTFFEALQTTPFKKLDRGATLEAIRKFRERYNLPD
jgi:hypothetical protein